MYDCEYSDDMKDMVFFVKNVFNQKLCTIYDSRVGKYIGFAEHCIKDADHYNNQAWKMRLRRIQVETVCRYNARLFIKSTLERNGTFCLISTLYKKNLRGISKRGIKHLTIPLHWLNLLHWKMEAIVLSSFFN